MYNLRLFPSTLATQGKLYAFVPLDMNVLARDEPTKSYVVKGILSLVLGKQLLDILILIYNT